MPYVEMSDGARIYYRDEGTGPMVLLVHGGTGTGDYDWEYLRPTLARRFRVITPDLRGHGRSSDPQWQLSLDSIAQDMLDVVQPLGQRPAAVVGFSMGGTAMLRHLCRWPATAEVFVGIGLSRTGDPSRVQPIVTGPWPAELRALQHDHGADADHWRRLRERMAASWAHDLSLQDHELASVVIPTLVVCGDRDVIEPVESTVALARALPAAELLVLPGAGHFAIRDRPVEFATALEGFLDRHLGGEAQPTGPVANSRRGLR
jgi:pimeloyl-ACP methyl ester carboxylesterase